MHPFSIQYDQSGRALAQELAQFLGVNAGPDTDLSEVGYVLYVQGEHLSLDDVTNPKTKPFSLDFNRPRPGQGKDPLLRAIGKKPHTVLDLTAGWCSDAIHIARQGYNVTALEINKLVYIIAAQSLEQINDSALRSRISLNCISAKDYLENLRHNYDVIYLDPMFPQNPKSSATRKELQLLREISDIEFDKRNFELAMMFATQRVVVKRPHYAPPLADGKVGETKSKLVRFDIYKPTLSNAGND